MNVTSRILILSLMFASLLGCGGGSREQAVKVTPTYTPPKLDTIEDGGYKIARGATRLAEVSIQYDSQAKAMRVHGKIEYQGLKDLKWQVLPLDLVGSLDGRGVIVLKSHDKKSTDSSDVRFGAKATCLSEAGTCYSSFVDIYVYADGVVYHHQVEANQDHPPQKNPPASSSSGTTPKPVTPEIPAHPVKDDEEPEINDEIDENEGKAGPYVGSIPDDIEKILEVSPVKTSPEPKKETPEKPPVEGSSQAIGAPNQGRLENGVSVLKLEKSHETSGFHVMRPERETHYSTSELAVLLAQMGLYSKKDLDGQKLYLGDLSRQNGGTLGRHKSHQNGLDADVAYYFNNKSFQGYFASAVAVDKAHPNWMVEAQWELFKKMVNTKIVDRIFVHSILKKSLCALAQSKGEIEKGKEDGLATETLRRLRPDLEHNTHFHLRIKCSKQQLRCRQMAEPAPGSGCF